MARILLCWELGAGRGHVVRLRQTAEELRERGHAVQLALQQPDLWVRERCPEMPVWQAPIMPNLLAANMRGFKKLPASMGDILARLGFSDAETVAAAIRSWQNLFVGIGPDVVVADFAPSLLLAARGEVPAVAVGNGFSLPPDDLESFPVLVGHETVTDEAGTLDTVNRGMAIAGITNPLDTLPGIFTCQAALPGTFAEVDPYRETRSGPLGTPALSGGLPPLASGEGDEIFVYGFGNMPVTAPLWGALADCGKPIRVFPPGMIEADRKTLADMGLKIETEAVPYERIAERSRIVINVGGPGSVCSAMLAGLPQAVVHYDLEKRLIGNAVADAGLGGHVPLAELGRDAFAKSLASFHEDDAMATTVREAASGFRDRITGSAAEETADAVQALL